MAYDHAKKKYFKYIPSRLDNKIKTRTIAVSNNTPYKVFIDPTYKCNSACIHCYSNSSPEQSMDISIEDAGKISSQLSNLGICQIAIAGGEPFIKKDIIPFIKQFLSNQIDVSITTSGLYFNEKISKEVSELDINSITISIDAIEKDLYKLIRGVDLFNILVRNLSLIRKYFSNKLAMRFSVMNNNCSPREIIEFACKHKFNVLKINKTHPLGRFNNYLNNNKHNQV
ncbi:MAG: radical SAM protein [Legionellales bacterium]|nr:radical SAM protein [Legionellales bacterium]